MFASLAHHSSPRVVWQSQDHSTVETLLCHGSRVGLSFACISYAFLSLSRRAASLCALTFKIVIRTCRRRRRRWITCLGPRTGLFWYRISRFPELSRHAAFWGRRPSLLIKAIPGDDRDLGSTM